MGLSILLKRKEFASISDQTKSKLFLASEICKFYAYHFEPRRIEVWRDASNESLGGIQVDKPLDFEDPSGVSSALLGIYHRHETDVDLLYNLVVKILGTWTFDDTRMTGYVEMTNDNQWRGSLGDIELDVYATKDVSDIVDLFWKSEKQVDDLVARFIEKFKGFEDDSHSLSHIIFALGPPCEVLVSDWRTSYSRIPNIYFQIFLRTMQKIQPEITTYIRLVNKGALTSDLYAINYFKEHLKRVAEKFGVKIDLGTSLVLVGREVGSYRKMYDELSSSLFRVLERSLQKDDDVVSKLRRETARLVGQETL